VLALTSNPEGKSVQHVGGDQSVARRIVSAAAAENQRYEGVLGSVGLVVGATIGSALTDLDIELGPVRGAILAPGLGAQGATPADLRATFADAYPQVLATSSRGILAAGPSAAALRAAAEETLAGLRCSNSLRNRVPGGRFRISRVMCITNSI